MIERPHFIGAHDATKTYIARYKRGLDDLTVDAGDQFTMIDHGLDPSDPSTWATFPHLESWIAWASSAESISYHFEIAGTCTLNATWWIYDTSTGSWRASTTSAAVSDGDQVNVTTSGAFAVCAITSITNPDGSAACTVRARQGQRRAYP